MQLKRKFLGIEHMGIPSIHLYILCNYIYILEKNKKIFRIQQNAAEKFLDIDRILYGST